MIIKAHVVGVDEWSRVVIKTEKGTSLCDISCLDLDKIEKDPSRGDWHTMTVDYGEPISRIRSDIEIQLVDKPEVKEPA